jgi:hypothetical protein
MGIPGTPGHPGLNGLTGRKVGTHTHAHTHTHTPLSEGASWGWDMQENTFPIHTYNTHS